MTRSPSPTRRTLALGLLLALGTGAASALDLSPNKRIEADLTELLFDLDADEYTAYRFTSSAGRLEITFASNTPRDLAKGVLEKIKAIPGVAGVRENFGGMACSRF
ncbi:MAG: hypothetical protein IBJ14_04480 [Hydrogenophaga sp.]|nr:hypothetical protein [Hydrogenophaga sp.]